MLIYNNTREHYNPNKDRGQSLIFMLVLIKYKLKIF